MWNQVGLFLFSFGMFFVNVYSYLITSHGVPTSVTPGTASTGKCPLRKLTSLFTASFNRPMSVSSTFPPPTIRINNPRVVTEVNVEESEVFQSSVQSEKVALPWKESINPATALTYMPILQKQLELIESLGMEPVSLDEKFVYQSSSARPARIGNLCFRSKQFRCVRLTYFDGGDAVQVFNSLWYPSYEYDLPMFGADLISLGKNRILNVIDFQPLHPTDEYSQKYIHQLSSIRAKYPDLHGVLSGKIYDDTSFFSKNMLFGRFTDTSKFGTVVQPAHNEYIEAYIKLMQSAVPNSSEDSQNQVKSRQRAYDIYSAEKDPAVGLFDAYFGKDWSHDFVHKYLFSLSADPSDSNSIHKDPIHNYSISSSGEVAATPRP